MQKARIRLSNELKTTSTILLRSAFASVYNRRIYGYVFLVSVNQSGIHSGVFAHHSSSPHPNPPLLPSFLAKCPVPIKHSRLRRISGIGRIYVSVCRFGKLQLRLFCTVYFVGLFSTCSNDISLGLYTRISILAILPDIISCLTALNIHGELTKSFAALTEKGELNIYRPRLFYKFVQ